MDSKLSQSRLEAEFRLMRAWCVSLEVGENSLLDKGWREKGPLGGQVLKMHRPPSQKTG